MMKLYTACCIHDLNDWYNIEIVDVNQFEDWLYNNEELKENSKYYEGDLLDGHKCYGLDTIDRDDLGDEISLIVCGDPWPINMDGQGHFEKFMNKFKSNVDKFPWIKLTQTWYD